MLQSDFTFTIMVDALLDNADLLKLFINNFVERAEDSNVIYGKFIYDFVIFDTNSELFLDYITFIDRKT
ncbi:MAG: hypothetical protein JXB48_21555, partial [Candidatus Latescibacteria bacterium]|nr:hypothetical protein [Candidatus Latescibacterota bacterium]